MKIKTYLLSIFLITALNAQSTPYVILISFDGFRWDYSDRGITPNLDKMKLSGVHASSMKPVFPSKTFPNHYSIITGMYPENHGIIGNNFVDPIQNKRYRVGDSNSVRESSWYLGEAFWQTAKRNGIITADYFWPGAEINLEYRRPDFGEKYKHKKPYKERIDGIINWLKFPQAERPHFISLYFDATDTYGHKFGPNSQEVNQAIQNLDSILGYLNAELAKLEIKDSINIILVSDHGMTEVSPERTINIDDLLSGYNFNLEGEVAFADIEVSKEDLPEVFNLLKKNENHYKVYLKNEVPSYFHYSKHPFISSIVLIADLGWQIMTKKDLERNKKNYSKGNHGYDNNQLDMHGIFFASGPQFKSNYKVGTILNIDIYPLLAKIFNITPRANIDGNLERIEYILKN